MMYRELFSLKDRVAVVTGGAGLIGREISMCLRDFGARVLVADIDEGQGAGFAKREGMGFLRLDITEEASIKRAFDEVEKSSGRLDILVNAAYPRTRDWGLKFEDVPFESWKTNVTGHMGGYFAASREAAEMMRKSGNGAIVNLASTYGVVAPDFSVYEGTDMTMPAAYSSIKAGIITFTKYLAAYYGRFGIRANAVSPGGVEDRQPLAFRERYSRKTPLGRMARPGEVAGAVVFLASDAGSYVTGHNLMVDGGWTAW